MNSDGSCNVDILHEVLTTLNKSSNVTVVIKSTVIPGTTERFNSLFNNLTIVLILNF